MVTYPLPTLAATVSPTGITAPSFADILASLVASYQSIYGSDAYLEPDSQDGQLLAIFAAAINDSNNTAISVYNAFSPATAVGAGLSSVVKINGLERATGSDSSVTVTVVGQANTTITNGVVEDGFGNQWNLPPSVTIPGGGSIDVTATCQTAGAITAAPGTITKINTPTYGWQSVTNSGSASVGNAVETDAQLRTRQATSTANPAQSITRSVLGAVQQVAGVARAAIYENDTNGTDANGLPPHSISAVVQGGAVLDIATAIARRKTPGTATYGTTAQTVTDDAGIADTINFYQLTQATISVNITIKALSGYAATTGTALQQALVDWINAHDIGQDVYYTMAFGPANLNGSVLNKTYNITAITIEKNAAGFGTADLVVAFNEGAVSDLTKITLLVT